MSVSIEKKNKFYNENKVAVDDLASYLGVSAEDVLVIIGSESSFDPTAVNENGGATGLIQFMPNTAKGLGVTTDEIKNMSVAEQLDLAKRFYAPYKDKINNVTDMYMATFYPAALYEDDPSYKIGTKDNTVDSVYNQNPGISKFAPEGQNFITKEDFTKYVDDRTQRFGEDDTDTPKPDDRLDDNIQKETPPTETPVETKAEVLIASDFSDLDDGESISDFNGFVSNLIKQKKTRQEIEEAINKRKDFNKKFKENPSDALGDLRNDYQSELDALTKELENEDLSDIQKTNIQNKINRYTEAISQISTVLPEQFVPSNKFMDPDKHEREINDLRSQIDELNSQLTNGLITQDEFNKRELEINAEVDKKQKYFDDNNKYQLLSDEEKEKFLKQKNEINIEDPAVFQIAIDETIGNVSTLDETITNENSKGDEQANIDDNQNKWETNTSQIRNDLTDLQTIIINDDGSYTEEEIKAAKDRYNQKMNELKTLHDDNDRQSSDDVIQFETFANDNEINLDFSFVETKENKKGPEGESPVILNLNNRKLELQELLNTTEDAEEYKKIKKQIYDIDQEITSLQNPDFTEEDMDPETKTLTKDEKSFIDKLGGPGTLVSLGMLGMAAPALLKDVEVQDYPELSSAMDEHIKQAKDLANQGFSAAEEAQIRQDIDSAYKAGITNLIRGTAGDRARFLAGSGMVDANRAKALLDFASKDAQLQRQNSKDYGELLQFKENYNFKKDSTQRSEELQMQLANKGSAAALASEAVSSIVQNIQDEKMYGKGSMYDLAMRSRIEEMGFELPGGKSENTERESRRNLRKAANYYNVSEEEINAETLTPYVTQDTVSNITTNKDSKSGTYIAPFIDPSEVGTNTYIDEFGQETEVSVSPFAGTVTPESITAPFRSKFKRFRK